MLVTAAIFMIAVTAFAGLALAGGAVYSAAEEGHRAADFAALAAASNLPTLNLGTTENPLGLPAPSQLGTPLGTVDTTMSLPTLNEDFTLGACAVAARQFGEGRSPITDTYATAPTTCEPRAHLANQWLQHVADCLSGTIAAADCTRRLEAGLASFLPAPEHTSPVVTAIQAATTEAGVTGQVVTAELLAQLQTLNATLGGALTPLLSMLNQNGGVSIDMTRLAPALLTPQVTVTITQLVDVPGAGLVGAGPVTLSHASTARRAIKNAVVLPTVGLPQPGGGFVFDPNTLVVTARDAALGALQSVGAVVTPAADQAVQQVVCPGSTEPCPVVSSSFSDLLADVRDAVDPPNGPAPDAVTLVNNAIAQGEPIMAAVSSYAVDPSQILGSTVYSLPIVRQLLPGLLFIPAFDVVPVVLSAGPLGRVFATPVDTAVTAARTRGLYRARLVD